MKLTSREYKLTLHADRFAGDHATCRAAMRAFWADAGRRLTAAGIAALQSPERAEPDKQRDLLFLDTVDKALFRRAGFVYRMRRRTGSDGEWQATLKFRHGDRLLSAAKDYRRRGGGKGGRGKLEEDIKAVPRGEGPGFWALFSRSVDAGVDDRARIATIGDCLRPFSRLPSVSMPPVGAPVTPVGGLAVVEHVHGGGALSLSDDVEAECALILWWRKGEATSPIAAEFSFRFALAKGEVEAAVATSAWDAMTALYGSGWVAPRGTTKTALVYGGGEA
ncbi:hypothetical protein LXM94_05740 [Rhizobium sp. TRM95111]|uniref:hypothetical protein n=1 Tax=Rhizobium alarense TaxID=2846851 RepID=UPI001F24F760|nr:hypothetical protein [Rhizobium alarense]MCF3639467.1 hypothetical protein [Rhizobium alarense]